MATQQVHSRSVRKVDLLPRTDTLEAIDITVMHGSRTTLRKVNLTIRPGHLTALIGPSGAGKTTLLKTLALLENPASGSLILNGSEYQFPLNSKTQFKEPWPTVTTVFQQLFLWPHLTLRQNITLALGKKLSNTQNDYLEHLLVRFQMTDFIDRYPNQASVGQKQRAALVRALVLKPKYLLLDEITSALDVEQIAFILSELTSLKEQGIGLLLITHLLQFARQAADSIVFLEQGQILAAGSTEVITNPTQPRVKQFLERAQLAS